MKDIIQKLQKLDRYYIEGGFGTHQGETSEKKDEDGPYVKWEDIEKIINQ